MATGIKDDFVRLVLRAGHLTRRPDGMVSKIE